MVNASMQEEAYAVRLGLKDSSSNFPMKPVGQPRVSSYVLPNSHKGHCEELVFPRATHLSREKYRYLIVLQSAWLSELLNSDH